MIESRHSVAETSRCPVTARAFAIGMALVALLAWVTPYNDYVVQVTLMAGNYLPIGAFFLLVLLTVAVNGTLRLIRPRTALKPAELIVIWCMLAAASSIPGSGLMRFLIPHIIAPTYYADEANRWDEFVLPHLPDPLVIRAPDSVRGFFEGARDGGVPWSTWLAPLTAYGLFVLTLYFSFFCLSTLLRRQWSEHERFTFPLVQAPVEMVEEPEPGRKLGPLWSNPLLWQAILVLTFVHTINGLHRFWPLIPDIDIYGGRLRGIADRPWYALNGIAYPLYPVVMGVGYLLKAEVLFSLWFFYLFFQFVRVVLVAVGVNPARNYVGYCFPGYAFASQQTAGMALGLVAWTVWNSRGYLRQVCRQTFFGEQLIDDRNEAMPLRWALVGWLASAAVLYGWLCWFGRNPLTALCTLLFGMTAYIVLTWMVAQGGLVFLQAPWAGSEMAVSLFGFQRVGPRAAIVSGQIEGMLMLDLREFTLPQLVNAQKCADLMRLDRRRLMLAIAAAMVLTLAVAGHESIRLPYQYGAVTMNDRWAYQMAPKRPLGYVATIVHDPPAATPGAWLNVGGGAALLWGLMFLQTRLIGFPLHPAGLIFAPTYPMSRFWFSLMLAWLAKGLILRYGGLQLYRRVRPLFLGLIIGDTVNGAIWIIVGLLTGVKYVVLPL